MSGWEREETSATRIAVSAPPWKAARHPGRSSKNSCRFGLKIYGAGCRAMLVVIQLNRRVLFVGRAERCDIAFGARGSGVTCWRLGVGERVVAKGVLTAARAELAPQKQVLADLLAPRPKHTTKIVLETHPGFWEVWGGGR